MKPSTAKYKKEVKLIVELFDSIGIYLLIFNLTYFHKNKLYEISLCINNQTFNENLTHHVESW